MLTKLSTEQITKSWDEFIEPSIKACFPKEYFEGNDVMLEVLKQALEERLDIWAAWNEDFTEVKALLTGRPVIDYVFDFPKYLIFSYFVLKPLEDSEQYDSFLQLKIYAKELDCRMICAYTNNAHILKLAKSLRFLTTEQYLTIKI